MTRKLSIGAGVTVIASCIGYFAGAWFIIYALLPEHPEIAPSRLFHEAFSHAPFLIVALTVFQLLAFACTAGRTARLSSSYLASIGAEVSGLVALVHGLLSDFSAFDSLWWQLILGSAPVVMVPTVALVYFRTRADHAIAAYKSLQATATAPSVLTEP